MAATWSSLPAEPLLIAPIRPAGLLRYPNAASVCIHGTSVIFAGGGRRATLFSQGGRMIFKRSTKADRRLRKRQLLNTSVQVFSGSVQMDALGINLSDGGMCLFAIANLRLGSQVEIEFLPSRSAELVRVCGIVRHRALYLYGIEFLADSDQYSDSLAGVGAAADDSDARDRHG